MKKLTFLSVAILSAGLFFTSCKKDDTSTPSDSKDNETQLAQQTDDQNRFSTESDAADDDATLALESFGGSYVGARPISPLPIHCDADVTVDTAANPRTITITYSGTSCVGATRTRTGTVVLSFAPDFRWATAGAHFTVTYNNLKVTRLADNKSITINGNKTITNVSGGKLVNLALSGSPVIHTVKSDGMSVTFDNGSQRTWQVARQRTFTYNNGVVVSVTGIAPASVGTGVAEWGTNRFGRDFKTAIVQPLVFRQDCNFRLVSGQVQHTGFFVTTTVTFGLNAAGEPVTCPNGVYYYKIVWTGLNGQTHSYIGPY